MLTEESYLGWRVDFSSPRGEPSLTAPDSVSWRVFKNPVALGIGGVCAVLMEFADPRIRTGVWDHSTFKSDPIGRSRRTGTVAMLGVFGPQSAAHRVVQGVTNMHKSVTGKTPDGVPYAALDTDLLDWVAATAGYGFLTAYDRFVEPLTLAEKRQFFLERQTFAKLFGVKTHPKSIEDILSMMDALSAGFEPHPINTEFLDIMRSGRAVPHIPKSMQSAFAHASVSILPASIRNTLRLGSSYDLSFKGELLVKAVARLANRVPDRNSPAAQASRRLGLPSSFPWKSQEEKIRLLSAPHRTIPSTHAAK